MGQPRKDPLSGKYVLKCQREGCPGEIIAEQNYGMKYSVGTMVPMDPTNPVYGRCPQCQRHKMQVVQVPEQLLPTPPKGFTRLPEK